MDELPLPTCADVVIIGAGIVGCCTAYFLAKRGATVMVIEKAEVADRAVTGVVTECGEIKTGKDLADWSKTI